MCYNKINRKQTPEELNMKEQDNVKKEVVTIVDKNEYRLLMDYVKMVDPKAFVTVYAVNELRYQPKIKAGKNPKQKKNQKICLVLMKSTDYSCI